MPHRQKFVPASVAALRHYSLPTFTADLIAGVTVDLVALPLAMAFAISSGMPPQAGIYTGHPGLRHDLPDSRPVPLRRDRQADEPDEPCP